MTTGYVLNNTYYIGTSDDYVMVPQTTATADYSYTYIPQYYTYSEVDDWHRKSIFEVERVNTLRNDESIDIPRENELRDSIIDSEEFDKYLNEWSHNE